MLESTVLSERYQLPWALRHPEDWQKLVSQKQAGILLSTAQRSSFGSPNWVSDWQLETPFDIYFNSNTDTLAQHLESTRSSSTGYHLPSDRLETIEDEVHQALSHPLAYSFLLKARGVYKENIGKRAKNRASDFKDIPTQTVLEMQLDSETAQQMRDVYARLTLAFWDEAQQMGIKATKSSDEGIELAGEKLPAAILHFYWEPFLIDPQTAIFRFLGFCRDYLHSRAGEKLQVLTTHNPLALANLSSPEFLSDSLPNQEKAGRIKQPTWNDAFAHIEDYQRKHAIMRDYMTNNIRQKMDAFFFLQTGSKSSTLAALGELFPGVSPLTLRRQINKGLNILKGRERPSSTGKEYINGGPGKRYFEYKLFRDAFQNPEILAQFNRTDRELIQAYYLENPEQTITGSEVGKKLGIHESNVSRRLARANLKLARILS